MTFIEEEQIRNLKEHKNGAMETLIEAYTQPLMAGSMAMGFSPADAEELTQETFAAFLSAIDRFETRSQLKTFLFGILYNKAATMRQKRHREESTDTNEEMFADRFDAKGMWITPPQGPEDRALNAEIRAWIEKCSQRLSMQQRTAFFLKETEGESSDSICNVLGVSYTNLRVLMYRARMKLRECLEINWLKKSA